MTNDHRPRLVFLLQTPPPIGGVTVKGSRILDGYLWDRNFDVRHVETGVHAFPGRGRLGYRLARLRETLRATRDAELVFLGLTREEFWLLYPPLILAARRRKQRLVVHKFAGGFHRQMPRRGPGAFLARVLVSAADRFILETDTSRRAASEHGYAVHDRILTNFVPVSDASVADPAGPIFFVGQVRLEKGIDVFLDLARRFDREKFAVLGPVFDDARDLMSDLPSNVEYLGSIDHKGVPEILSRGRVLLMPTRCMHEGHPAVILEAMALGIPVIANRTGAIGELLTGTRLEKFMAPMDDAEALASSLRMFLSLDENVWRELSMEAQKHARRFSSENALAWLADEMMAIVESNGARCESN